MEIIPGYTILDKISETNREISYRLEKEVNNTIFILKILKTPYPSPSRLALVKQEFDTLSQTDCKGIIKPYDILNHDNKPALIHEYCDAETLFFSKYEP